MATNKDLGRRMDQYVFDEVNGSFSLEEIGVGNFSLDDLIYLNNVDIASHMLQMIVVAL